MGPPELLDEGWKGLVRGEPKRTECCKRLASAPR